jgi:S-DNA-T family DNA segregation ATPase FtsK/SpoIIIE
MTELKLPEDSKLSLAVISGPQSGKIFQIEKPKMVIGRQDADITVEDPEISRQHAAIEVAGDRVTLIDLGSTNGVFMGDEQISEAPLENQSEFSVGSSTLMLIVTRRGT